MDAGADRTPFGPDLEVGEGDLGGGGDDVVLCRHESIRASCTGERKDEWGEKGGLEGFFGLP